MPTILVQLGWRLFFYANEGSEPIHIHCRKGDLECKYWMDVESFDIRESYSYGLSQKDKKEIRKIIFEHFEYISEQWQEFQERKAMEKFHSVENVRCEAGKLSLIVDGKPLEFPLEKISKLLANATADQLDNFEISPSGYGIHWPLLDEDISVDGLLEIIHKPDTNRKSA